MIVRVLKIILRALKKGKMPKNGRSVVWQKIISPRKDLNLTHKFSMYPLPQDRSVPQPGGFGDNGGKVAAFPFVKVGPGDEIPEKELLFFPAGFLVKPKGFKLVRQFPDQEGDSCLIQGNPTALDRAALQGRTLRA
jgi:hypothetical protein